MGANSRRPIIVGNWKMNGLQESAEQLVDGLMDKLRSTEESAFDIAVCPPFPYIHQVAVQAGESVLLVGAQDCHVASSGAHTGDISADMIKDTGANLVIVGHSERRQDHFETSELVADKAAAAHQSNLIAIICVGETEAEREAGKANEVVSEQLEDSIPEGADSTNTIIAYEPVWAIGTGKTATTEDVTAMHDVIRKRLSSLVPDAADMRILYGGSVKPENATELLALEDVDGALVGGASLSATDFWSIAQSSD